MRVLFLDIDGVLNSGEFWKRWDPPPKPPLDPNAVFLLNRLVQTSRASVVVSSNWRGAGTPWLRDRLRAAGYTGSVIGRTPTMRGEIRGAEIAAWLAACRRPVERFVILDDDDDMGDLSHRLVQTCWRFGLTETEVARAVELFRA